MASHNELGEKGEELATKHLQDKGFQIIATNWTNQKEEIDIIAQNKTTIFFIEVKTRASNYFGEPEIFVTKQKRQRIIKAANAYIQKNNVDLEAQFDIISVILNRGEYKIHHIESAFSLIS